MGGSYCETWGRGDDGCQTGIDTDRWDAKEMQKAAMGVRKAMR